MISHQPAPWLRHAPGSPPVRPARRRSRAPRNLAQIQGRLVEVATELQFPAPTTGRKYLTSKGGKRARRTCETRHPKGDKDTAVTKSTKRHMSRAEAPAGTRGGTGAHAGGARPPRRGRPRRVGLRALGVVAAEPQQVPRLQPRQRHPDSHADADRHPRGQLQGLEARLQPPRTQRRARHRDPRAHARQGARRAWARGAPPPRGLPRGPRLRRQADRRRAASHPRGRGLRGLGTLRRSRHQIGLPNQANLNRCWPQL